MTTPIRILCIEDNPMNWRLVQRLLSQGGYEAHWAEDGLKGYELAVELKPALVLLDINLPGLSGFEVATKLRQNQDLAGMLIVALTAKTMRSDRETALVTGCDGFISKPIDPFLFVGQVEAYMGGHRDHLEKGREGAALRQFSQQVVVHLEAQLREAQEGNRKLLEIQGTLEQRNRHLSRLLSLSQDIILVRDPREILIRVLGQLREDLALSSLCAYRLHSSGGYLIGLQWEDGSFQEGPILPAEHALVVRLSGLPRGTVITGQDLRQSVLWEDALSLGYWEQRSQALLLPLHSHAGTDELWGFIAGARPDPPFLPFEGELAALHTGLVQVTLENAELIQHLDETSQALGASYDRLEGAYGALQEAQKALGAQDRKAALGSLFMNMAQSLQTPVTRLKTESLAVERFVTREGLTLPEDRQACQSSLDGIQQAIVQVDGLVKALLRRGGRGEPGTPEWMHLHELTRQELDLMHAEGVFPEQVVLELNLQAHRDLMFGVYSDFAEVLGHMAGHALLGDPGHIFVRTWGGQSHFRLEMEDDGDPLSQGAMDQAFEPFSGLRSGLQLQGRLPGPGLPACAQLMNAYGGTMEIQKLGRGSLVRLALPME